MRITITLLLSFTAILANAEFIIPVEFHGMGDVERVAPKSPKHFVDGTIDLGADCLRFKFDSSHDISFFFRSSIYTNMGFVREEVVFDPRDVHYSLVPGLRYSFGNWLLTLQLRHDCFHEIERDNVPTMVWNIIDLRFSPRDYQSSQRNAEQKVYDPHALALIPRFDWEVSMGAFPHIDGSTLIFQDSHPLKKYFEADLRFVPLRLYETGWLLRYKPALFWQMDDGLKQRHYLETGVEFYGQGGIMTLFYSWTPVDEQYIWPRDGLRAVGIRWEL